MSLLTTSSVLARARRAIQANFSYGSGSARILLENQINNQASVATYDIFLSHAFDDRYLILGVTLTLEDLEPLRQTPDRFEKIIVSRRSWG